MQLNRGLNQSDRESTVRNGTKVSVITNQSSNLGLAKGMGNRSNKALLNRSIVQKGERQTSQTTKIQKHFNVTMQAVVAFTSLAGMLLSDDEQYLNANTPASSIITSDLAHYVFDDDVKGSIVNLVSTAAQSGRIHHNYNRELEKSVNQQLDELYKKITNDVLFF